MPVLALSLAGSGVGLALQSVALLKGWSISTFLGLRVLTGMCAGASPIAKAYLADVGTRQGQLPKYLAWRDAAGALLLIASASPVTANHKRCSILFTAPFASKASDQTQTAHSTCGTPSASCPVTPAPTFHPNQLRPIPARLLQSDPMPSSLTPRHLTPPHATPRHPNLTHLLPPRLTTAW